MMLLLVQSTTTNNSENIPTAANDNDNADNNTN